MSIIPRIPSIQGLIQTIQPIRCGRHVRNFVARNVLGNKTGNRMADEHVGVLNVVPKVCPNIFLRTTGLSDEIAADLDV